MRVAYVSADPGVPVFGRKGCSIHVQEVIRALLRRGAEVELHTTRLGGAPPPDLECVEIFRLPQGRGLTPGARERAALAVNDQLAITLKSRPACDVVYERHALWSTAGMDFARTAGIPGILEVNAPLIEEQKTHRSLVHREIAELMVKRAFDASTLLVAVSDGVAAHVLRFEKTRGRVHVVPNGVDPERFSPRPDPPSAGSEAGIARFSVGFVGSLKPWHDLASLVEAFEILHRRHPASRLLVVGDGPERGKLIRELETRGLMASSQLTGAVAPADVPRFADAMDVGVAPYPDTGDCYFSPLKIFEYMAAGLPIVASRVGQIPELIEHEQSGLLCAPSDPQALTEALVRLCEDPELRLRLGRRARATALRKHTWDSVVARILDLAGLASPAAVRAEA